MKKLRNKILSAVLVLSLLLTSSSFAFAVGEDSTAEENIVQIPREQLSVKGFSSQQYEPTGVNATDSNYQFRNEGPANHAIDGNTSTFWHTIWYGTDPITNVSAGKDRDKYIIINLGAPIYLKEIKVYQRLGNFENVRIEDYGVYLSLDGETFSENPEMSGSFENTAKTNILTFNEPVYTQYVKFRGTDLEKDFATLAELEFFEDTSISKEDVPTITTQPVSQEVNNLNEALLTVKAENANSYQWYKTSDGTLDGGVAIENGKSESYVPTEEGYYFVKITSENSSYIFSNIVEVSLYEAQIEDTETKGSLAEMVSQATKGQTISILTDINLDTALNISKEITIKTSNTVSEPYTIKRASGVDGVMFTVATNGNLTLDNIIIDGGAEWKLDGEDSTPAAGAINSGIKASKGIVNVESNAILTVEAGATLRNNDSSGGAGAIVFAQNSEVNIKGKVLNNRIAGDEGKDSYNGGAACGQGTMNISENAEIAGNYAKSRGGAITIWGGSSTLLNINGAAQIHDNKCGGNDNSGAIAYGGGAICVDAGTLNIGEEEGSAVKIYGNESYKSGGALAIDNGTININNCEIYGNKNTEGSNGGVIYIHSGATVNLNGGTIRNNEGYGDGGVIFINAAGTVNLNGGTIQNNVGHGAGAIYLLGANSKVNVGDVTMSGNTVATDESVGDINVGTGINYFHGIVTITGNPNFSGDTNIYMQSNQTDSIYLRFSETCDLVNDINVIVQGADKDEHKIGVANNETQTSNIISHIKVPKPDNRVVYRLGTEIKYGTEANYSTNLASEKSVVANPDGSASTTLTVETTGTDVTYEWYSCEANGDNPQLMAGQITDTLTLDNLTIGSRYYYCVIDNGDESSNEPVKSNVCEVKVTDFYPCSKAIDKFKNI